MASVVKALLTNGVRVASRSLVLLIAMFSDDISLSCLFCKRVDRTLNIKSCQIDDERSRCFFSAFWLAKLLAQASHTSLCVFWEVVVMASQQLRPSHKPLNRRTTPPIGASLGVSLVRISCKSACCIVHKKNRLIDDERILNISSDFLE